MTTLRRFISIGLVFLCSTMVLAARGVSQVCHTSQAAPSCGASPNQIIEEPQGPIDGRNAAFKLSAIPISSADVHVSINGIEVPQGERLSVKDQCVLFSPSAAPQAGALVRATYQTQFISTGRRGSNLAALIAPLAGLAILRMVEQEKVGNGSVDATVLDQPKTFQLSESEAGSVGERGLSMLVQRLSVVDDEQRSTSDQRESEELRSLIGVEGTGDVAPATPYDLLSATSPNRTTGVPKGESDQDVVQYRSLKMLQQILEGQSPK